MSAAQFHFSALPDRYAIVRLGPNAALPDWASRASGFVSITRTEEELSIVCAESFAASGDRIDGDWSAIKLHGPFAFDQTGVLSSFAVPLAEAGIGIFAISTFDTDYILIKRAQFEAALGTLETAGHVLETVSA